MKRKPKKPAPRFNANALAQPVYQLVSDIICELSREQAIEVLDEISSNFEMQSEAITEEIERDMIDLERDEDILL